MTIEESKVVQEGGLSADSRRAQIQDQMTAANPSVHCRAHLLMQIIFTIKTVQSETIYPVILCLSNFEKHVITGIGKARFLLVTLSVETYSKRGRTEQMHAFIAVV